MIPSSSTSMIIHNELVLFVIIIVFVTSSFLVTPQSAHAATIEKFGSITSNETWTSGNTYLITCVVTINAVVMVNLQPDVVVIPMKIATPEEARVMLNLKGLYQVNF